MLGMSHVTLVTYMNEVNNLFGFLQVTASAKGLYPKIIGYGDHCWWPDGLGAKINALRKFVSEVPDDELVVFVDAFDVLVLADAEEISSKFAALERRHKKSLFFNAEKDCFPDFEDICAEGYPPSPHRRWAYLNSGVFVGRGHALKQMLRDPVADVMPGGDQAFYQRYFRRFPERVGLDTECELACATQGIGGDYGVEWQGRRLLNTVTSQTPALVHFVSDSHWAVWRGGRPTSDLQDGFSTLFPVEAKRLFEVVEVVSRVGSTHRQNVLELHGAGLERYLGFMHMTLCLRCSLGARERECVTAVEDGCPSFRLLLVVLLLPLVVFALWLRRGWRRRESVLSKAEKAV